MPECKPFHLKALQFLEFPLGVQDITDSKDCKTSIRVYLSQSRVSVGVMYIFPLRIHCFSFLVKVVFPKLVGGLRSLAKLKSSLSKARMSPNKQPSEAQ